MSTNEYKIKEEVYIVLLRYFKGNIIYLTDDKIKNLKKNEFEGKQIKKIDESVLKTLSMIAKLRSKKPKEYASMQWIYPQWSEEEKEQQLRKAYPEDYEESEEESEEDKQSYSQYIEPENGKFFTFEEQVDILINFYKKYDPKKTEEEVIGIINRRRPKEKPLGTRIPSKPWRELCERYKDIYGTNPLSIEEEVEDGILFNGIIPQRKAFIEWVNTFYQEQRKELNKYNLTKHEKEQLKINQYFVKKYLSIETPFRGLLVYHGLGKGKTATSVVTSEGLSKTMPIFTFLPASLETNYIKEVRRWGDNLFNVDKNNWIFYPLHEIKGDFKLRKKLENDYQMNEKRINQIFNTTKAKLKKKIEEEDEYKSKERSLMQKINSIKGIYLQSDSLDKETRKIYTSTGTPLLKEGEIFEGECFQLSEEQKIFINEEINYLIKLKYNFIHYNGFPDVHRVDFQKKVNEDLLEEKTNETENQRLVKYFIKKYQENLETYGIPSPFRENVIIIDEVHNFVNEIINGSAPATIFYNWIVNSEDIKIIFLSGTPIINKPAEIAILYNMLRGMLTIYEYSISSNKDEYEVQQELRELFYKERSSIEQLHVTKRKGKLIVSFMKNKTNYESVLEGGIIKTIRFNDHTLEEFLEEIIDGLESYFHKETILPSRKQIKEVSSLELKKGKPHIFDKEIDLIFNRKQRLFDIYENEHTIDLTKNENFLEYFFDENFNIPERKQVLLRRMLLGLTSYYPIDRSSITDMPSIIEPKILPLYREYNISKDINIIPCFMSSKQWVKYEEEYAKDKLKKLRQMRKKDIYNSSSDYNIRTRQNCNIIYENDSFRTLNDNIKKEESYQQMIRNGHFSMNGTLHLFSPKFYQIMKNIEKFIDKGIPTGKILYYSDFRHDSGSEVFEHILIQNGYEKYDSEKEPIDKLIAKQSIKKRYTFITGKELQEQRRINKEAFNHKENLYGEYIHIILISSSGAEGISLEAVRQVHIMEPFWNYIRVNQVLGRAARMESHLDLPEDQRNVEQYIYLSMLPEGNTLEEIFYSLKDLDWPEVQDIFITEDIKQTLINKHRGVYKTITKILSVKKNTNDRTVDQILFDIMEKKNKISSKITNIIKESSVDCIQTTKDDIQLNEKCLRFSKKVTNEEAHFPNISSSQLNQMDQKQFKSTFHFFIEPDIYVILAKKNENDLFVYYQVQDITDKIDIRYIRENGIRICDYEPFRQKMIVYEKKEHPMKKMLGNLFSIFQSIYHVSDYIVQNKIEKSIFPNLDEVIQQGDLEGYVIKYNITDRLFYSPYSRGNIIRLYDYNHYKKNLYSTHGLEVLLLRNQKLFRKVN